MEVKLTIFLSLLFQRFHHFFKYNQQDATLYNILYYCQCFTCSRRFFRTSSGAQKLYTQHLVYVKFACCYRQRQQQARILYNVASCWLYLKKYISNARSNERHITSIPFHHSFPRSPNLHYNVVYYLIYIYIYIYIYMCVCVCARACACV